MFKTECHKADNVLSNMSINIYYIALILIS